MFDGFSKVVIDIQGITINVMEVMVLLYCSYTVTRKPM